MTALRRTAAVAALVAVGAVAGLAGAPGAGAQVEIDATEVPAGSRTTLNFTIITGCGSSPTMEVAVTLPEGTFDIVPIPPPGFTTLVLDEGEVVVFQGGPLDAETPATFGIEMVTPNLPGVTVMYPVEQTCVDDTISWSDTNAAGEGAAPRLRLTANPSPLLPTTTIGGPTTAPAGGETTLPPLTDPASTEPPLGVDDGGGIDIGIVALVVAALGAGYWFIRRRRGARR
jgi:periplasmic copper chaperone A